MSAEAQSFLSASAAAETLASEPSLDRDELLSMVVDWEALGERPEVMLSLAEARLIKRYACQPAETQARMLEGEGDGQQLVQALVSATVNVLSHPAPEVTCTMLEGMLEHNPKQHVRHFVTEDGTTVVEPLLRVISRVSSGEYLVQRACNVIAQVYSARFVADPTFDAFLSWLVKQLRTVNERGSRYEAAAHAVTLLVRNEAARSAMLAMNMVDVLARVVNHPVTVQVQYEIGLALWVFSLSEESTAQFVASDAVVALAGLLKVARREKVIRVAVMALKNLLNKAKGLLNEKMLEADVLRTLSTLMVRQLRDPEIMPEIKTLSEALTLNVQVMTTYERYMKELEYGRLEWGPTHTEKFWRLNATRFEKDEFAGIRKLVELLDSGSPPVQAVACSDLGNFVRFYSSGRQVIAGLAAKERIMALLAHENEEVKKQALLACSKIMISNWEYLEK